ncbi:putative sulfate/molybdate transporter [Hydrogenophaga sp.]|uniref:putative sulfate/molybdate transporter n=1 Tax=Hydrogenophaga sp. TaxID=1904254 RepID=UPI0025BFC18A|nr:putative sulfate/molybdate transporter [Hydrogenophaga sp.]MBT9465258.1 putative sulfate/molybdate transporter [Hydrogenophaga sp.]
MPMLMAIGLAVGWWRQPGLMQLVTETPWTLALPAPQWTAFNQPGVWLAAFGLAAAQIPLTFGNAILGIVAETRRLFPAVNVDESRMARSTGFMNLLAGGLGAPPMCFGAGGMAAQVTCGARTGRAPIFLGTVLLLAGLFASGQLTLLLGLLPAGTIGAMLFVAGFSLTIGTAGSSRDKQARRAAHHRRRVGVERGRGRGGRRVAGSGIEVKAPADLKRSHGFFMLPCPAWPAMASLP